MSAERFWKRVKQKYRVSSKYRMQLEFNFPDYIIGKCRFMAGETWKIKTQKISITRQGIVFSDTIPLSWFTSSVLIPWTTIKEMVITDEMPTIDGVVSKPWSSDLHKQTLDFQYCTIRIDDPVEITIDLPWSTNFTQRVESNKWIDI